MTTVESDWRWADQYLPEIRKIVGPYLLEKAPLEVDRNQATDLVVLRAKNLQIACRIRRGRVASNYSDQFTLRSRRPSGAKTELTKIIEGWGDWMFYGFAAGSDRSLVSWSLIDLHALRAHLILDPGTIKSGENLNSDGTAFRWFDLQSFTDDPPILIASVQTKQQGVSFG